MVKYYDEWFVFIIYQLNLCDLFQINFLNKEIYDTYLYSQEMGFSIKDFPLSLSTPFKKEVF
jgi:hypothetical protein